MPIPLLVALVVGGTVAYAAKKAMEDDTPLYLGDGSEEERRKQERKAKRLRKRENLNQRIASIENDRRISFSRLINDAVQIIQPHSKIIESSNELTGFSGKPAYLKVLAGALDAAQENMFEPRSIFHRNDQVSNSTYAIAVTDILKFEKTPEINDADELASKFVSNLLIMESMRGENFEPTDEDKKAFENFQNSITRLKKYSDMKQKLKGNA